MGEAPDRRPDHRPYGRWRGVAGVLAIVLAATACGGGDSATDAPVANGGTPGDETAADADTAAFCEDFVAATTSGDDERLDDLLEQPPRQIEEPAAAIREADAAGDDGALLDAMPELMAWVELHCAPVIDAENDVEHLAVPADSLPDGLVPCLAQSAALLEQPAVSDGRMVLYGDTSLADPYAGPMLGVMWGAPGGYAGDSDPTPVRVRGTEGVAAPITVFQQTAPDELGTVIAWDEDGTPVGLFGRGWGRSQVDELVALADRLEPVDGGFRLPAEALPAGYAEMAAGDPAPLSLVTPIEFRYWASYATTGGGLISLHAYTTSPELFDAIRFLAPDLRRENVGGRDAIVGTAWHAGGPAVVTWREDDGTAIRLVGIDVDLDTVRELARRTRPLDRTEWANLVASSRPACLDPAG